MKTLIELSITVFALLNPFELATQSQLELSLKDAKHVNDIPLNSGAWYTINTGNQTSSIMVPEPVDVKPVKEESPSQNDSQALQIGLKTELDSSTSIQFDSTLFLTDFFEASIPASFNKEQQTIELSETIHATNISITNSRGLELFSHQAKNVKNSISVPTALWPSGAYFVILDNAGSIDSYKIMVESTNQTTIKHKASIALK